MLKNFISRFGWIFAVMIAGSALAEPHKIRVSDRAVTETLIAQGGRLIADYGGFQIIESDRMPDPAGPTSKVELADDLNVIHLNARPLDTRRPEIQALRRSTPSFSGTRLHLIHFAGPIKPEWLEALKESGVRIVGYIPNDAYLIYGNSGTLRRMQAWARSTGYVQWEGEYTDEYKIHPNARFNAVSGKSRSLVGNDLFTVQLIADTNANPTTLDLLNRLKLESIRSQFRILDFLNVTLRLPPDGLAAIAAQPDVISIQPCREPVKSDERQDQIIAGNVTGGLPSGPGYLAWLAGKGFSQTQFNASTFVIDICDSGIDNGTTVPGHFGLYCLGDPGRPSRVAYNRLVGTPNSGSTLQGCDGHGNLNAHIAAGYCGYSGFPFADSAGFDYGLGVCPFAMVGSSVIFDPNRFTYPNLADLQSAAYQSGARISANSWGSLDSEGAYDAMAQLYDALVRDAQPAGSTNAAAGNQQMIILFSAGNEGPDLQTLTSPGSAKNVITVGASENVRSLTPANGGNDSAGNDGCSLPDTGADNANEIADFSGRGSCFDGRMKPDLVAPGTHITGGVGQSGPASTNGTGLALACFDASGVDALPGAGACGFPLVGNTNNFFPLGQQFYTVSSGTSHSTPAVAGACALLRQDFINKGFSPPSPAMTKACLVNSARYLDGYGANDNLWSPAQGMGELNLGILFDGLPRILRDQMSQDKFTASGQTRTFTGMISDPTKPFRVTVAWTDAPGNTTGDAFNNDLDLTVTVGGYSYKGNVFAGSYSVTGGAYDKKNNVESVFLPAGLSGTFMVTITAANINSDGVPNEAPSLDQDFALVIYNATQSSLPVLVLDSASIVSENCSPGNGVIDPGETVTVAFALKNVGTSDTTNLIATLLMTNGVVSPGFPRAYSPIVAGGTAVTQAFNFTAIGYCGGTVVPVLQLQDGAIAYGSISTSFFLGTQIVTTGITANATTILIPGTNTMGPAFPYPSSVMVSGVAGTVDKITVTLLGLAHEYPSDIDVLLAGPTGTNVLLMSNCGGWYPITNVTLTFDDDAATFLINDAPITSGTYEPSGRDSIFEDFYPPAPVGPYEMTLSAFNGLNPNGIWSLYVQDVSSQDIGQITQGWQLSVGTSNTVCCTGAPPPPPLLQSISLSNGVATITWSAMPGQTYRLQYNTNLCGSVWNTLPPDVTATNFTLTRSTFLFPGTQCYYRVFIVP